MPPRNVAEPLRHQPREEWRRRLTEAYYEANLRYVRDAFPDLQLRRPDGRFTRIARRALKTAGRAGLRPPMPNSQMGEPDLRSYQSLLSRRNRFKAPFQSLLERKPLTLISVDAIRRQAGKSRDTFYAAFHSGVPGLYCHWATEQLDFLTAQIDERAIPRRIAGDNLERALRLWAEIVGRFVMELPYGRLPIIFFLISEIDTHGTSLTIQLEEALTDSSESDVHHQRNALDEFVSFASDLHRAGARLIHTLDEILKSSERLAAHRWKGKPEDAVWNYAVSFWQMVFLSLFAAGIMESEEELKHHQSFAIDVWLRGALGPK